ncbi:MAG: YggS family pyridoxal phosphate-dependent enzyme [Planctomycetes bacterium]|nr:YggS family pyridoxal phosphate-dependent enzyme [Planctomycetota bacterium]
MNELIVPEYLTNNLDWIRQKIEKSARKVNRDPSEIKLITVTKYADIETIGYLPALGLFDLGENKVQELVKKAEALPDSVTWHMIGHMQTNKIKRGLPFFNYLHSLDSLHLAEALENEANRINKQLNVFIQLNISGEESKYGIKPEELFNFYGKAKDYSHLKIIGLMTIAPEATNPEESRPVFRKLREYLDELKTKMTGQARNDFCHLSMGMTQDYDVAIEEGATFIRIGTALFKEAA